MSISALIKSFIAACRSPLGRTTLLALYYLAIILALVVMYGEGDFGATDFVYQGF